MLIRTGVADINALHAWKSGVHSRLESSARKVWDRKSVMERLITKLVKPDLDMVSGLKGKAEDWNRNISWFYLHAVRSLALVSWILF
jgi:hypothetical protein